MEDLPIIYHRVFMAMYNQFIFVEDHYSIGYKSLHTQRFAIGLPDDSISKIWRAADSLLGPLEKFMHELLSCF